MLSKRWTRCYIECIGKSAGVTGRSKMEETTVTLSSARLILGEVRHLVQRGGLIEALDVLEEAIALIEEYQDEVFTEIKRSL